MGLHVGLAVIEGPHARFEEVRRALWLPRKPDLLCTLEDLASPALESDHLGILDAPERILVYGHAVLDQGKAWLALSADRGRVLALLYDDEVLEERWAIYEDGQRRRMVNAVEDENGEILLDESGDPHPLEPPSSTDIDRMAALHLAFAGFEIEDHEWKRVVPAWRIAELPSP